jgi:HK97 family phage prohead protease
MKHELRTFQLRTESGGAGYILRGRAITYNALSAPITNFRERVAPGAFTRSLAANTDVKCLFNHDANRVLGRSKNGTLALIDGKDGLDFVCYLDPNNTEHRNLYSSVKRGDIDGCSFAFAVDADGGDEFDTDTDEDGRRFSRRTIRCAKIFDVSVVTNPAYPDATTVSARSKNSAPSTEQRKRFQAVVEWHRNFFRNICPKGWSAERYLEHQEMRSLKERAQKQAVVIAATTPKTPAFTESQLEETRNAIFPVRF